MDSNPQTGLLQQGLKKATVLQSVLQKETSALKNRQIDDFETLQSEKVGAIESMQAVLDHIVAMTPTPQSDPGAITDAEMSKQLSELLEECQQQHEKNALIIDQLLEANKAALNVLKASRQLDTTETYDKLGKVSRQSTMGHNSEV